MGVRKVNSAGPPALGTAPGTLGVVELPYGVGREDALGLAGDAADVAMSGGESGGTG